MTEEEFTAFYPQFAGFTPAIVMETYIGQANERFGFFTESDAEEARRLYTAHRLTMYARTALPAGTAPSREAIATAGFGYQKVASKKVGEVSVTYASGTNSAVSTDQADLAETPYGLQLLSMLKIYGRSVYVP